MRKVKTILAEINRRIEEEQEYLETLIPNSSAFSISLGVIDGLSELRSWINDSN